LAGWRAGGWKNGIVDDWMTGGLCEMKKKDKRKKKKRK
jgi:hypothetical protein